jgi:hypothetical protein
MKHIIVISGHRLQFQAFVTHILKQNLFVHKHPESVTVEGVKFMHITDEHQLRGYALGPDSELVKVGTWYELPQTTIQGIESQFRMRKLPVP